MRYRLAIFDFDGTLADSAAWFISQLDDFTARHGLRAISPAEIDTLRGTGTREIMRSMGVNPLRMPFIAADLRRRAAADAEHISLFPGTADVLATLHRKGVVLAIASSNAEATIRTILGPQLTAMIAAFECEASLFGKAQKFRRLMKQAGMTPAETICIGDEQRDMEAAHAVRAAAGAVLWGYATEELLARGQPAYMFRQPPDILEALGVAPRPA